jgi:asparagine synthase (glutamine-hydrolysing)
MCGIAGAWLDAGNPLDVVRAMTRVLVHRGPDDAGEWRSDEGNVALAHRRLSILDLSAEARQPMTSGSGRLRVVYNGEIYNYRELRANLERDGYAFRTRSDTEVLLAAWERWGTGCIVRLRGMFAFAIWDETTREVFLVRDRLGIKPLYYSRSPSGLLFASEVRALLASGLVSRQIDRQAVWDYLAYGAIAEPHTILRDVAALPPAHIMRISGNGFSLTRYWDVAEECARHREWQDLSYGEAVVELRRRLESATRYHLVSDVPVGAFLSGGIDSTAVVGLATAVGNTRVRTFSVGFGEEHGSLDELKWARLAAEHHGCDHTEVVLTAAAVDGLIDRAAGALDQPSVDGTNTYIVSEAARRSVVVALSGLGGDELFAGYPHFARYARRQTPARWASVLRGIANDRIAGVLPGRIRAAIRDLTDTPEQRLAGIRLLCDDGGRRRAVTAEFLGPFEPASTRVRIAALLREGLDPVAQVSYSELNGYLRDTLLRDADAMSMAHGLEIRPVLLDHEVVEFAFGLPAEFKQQVGRPKRVLTDAVADLLPVPLRSRRKMGFELPLAAWLQGPLRGRAMELVGSTAAHALFSPALIKALRQQLDGARGSSHRLWSLVGLLAFVELHDLVLDQ